MIDTAAVSISSGVVVYAGAVQRHAARGVVDAATAAARRSGRAGGCVAGDLYIGEDEIARGARGWRKCGGPCTGSRCRLRRRGRRGADILHITNTAARSGRIGAYRAAGVLDGGVNGMVSTANAGASLVEIE